ncbi:MAG TPA: hypothetical protein DEH78_05270, partial [Solibacterales bacterium]|nr:hypothetical protein [Bryobacterales bacterium]
MKRLLALLCLLPGLAVAAETNPTCTPSGGSAGDVIQGLSLKLSGTNTTIGSVLFDSTNRSNGTADQTIEGFGSTGTANGAALIVWMHKSNNSGQTELTNYTAPGPHTTTSPSNQAMGYQYRYGSNGADSTAITVANGGTAASTRIDMTISPSTSVSGLSEGTYCSANNAACTATLPSTYAVNDLLLEICSTSSSAGTISTPSGWTSLKADTTSGRKLYVFGKIATSGSAPLYTSDPVQQSYTSSSMVFRATTDTTGTRYGARLTDGSATP